MARTYNRLTATKVATLKAAGRYGDGAGLYLQVTGSGSKSWIFRYERNGRERSQGLGPVRDVTLAEAREAALLSRRLLRNGEDPLTKGQRKRSRKISFNECVEQFLAAREKGWRNEKHRAQWRSTLTNYAYPVIGTCPVDEIDVQQLLRILKPIWHAKHETASRLRGRIDAVLDFATAHGLRSGDNPARWTGHLSHLLGRVADRPVKHHSAMPFAEIPYFMSTLRDRDSLGARALELTILTAVRSGEMLGAKWCEFDLATQTWTIPAERMKARREHRIPLSDYAVELISKLSRGSEFVFQGAKRGKQVSNMTMAAVLKRMHLGHFTVHGFRSTFRDWAAETTNTPNHVVEMALAHVIGDKVEAAYRRGDLFEKRRELMNVWSEFCSEGSTTYPNSDQTATTEKHREEGSGPW